MDAGSAEAGAGPIVSTRQLPFAREAVFAALRDPDRLARWWGPAGHTNAFEEFDFRPGGTWRFTMRAPDGTGYAMHHRFEAIEPPDRIVVRHLQSGHDFTLEITLAEQPPGTALTWRMRFDDPAETARLRDFLQRANAENLARLESLLAHDFPPPSPAPKIP